ncbi:MAG: large-conductance mechanosensitive channel protein MscL [Chloroflexi bacterium]|nr:large-conductance mechanosensitive channel protein MscL [Chloroflexota bacterium]
MLDEFKKFIMRGNVIDMAVGIIIGAAFATIITSLVDDILMPPIGLLLGGVDFSNLFITLKEGVPPGPYASLTTAQEAGAVTINYGVFLNALIAFLIVAFAIFLLIRWVNRLKGPAEEPATTDCPYCLMDIPIGATRCGHCGSELAMAAAD